MILVVGCRGREGTAITQLDDTPAEELPPPKKPNDFPELKVPFEQKHVRKLLQVIDGSLPDLLNPVVVSLTKKGHLLSEDLLKAFNSELRLLSLLQDNSETFLGYDQLVPLNGFNEFFFANRKGIADILANLSRLLNRAVEESSDFSSTRVAFFQYKSIYDQDLSLYFGPILKSFHDQYNNPGGPEENVRKFRDDILNFESWIEKTNAYFRVTGKKEIVEE